MWEQLWNYQWRLWVGVLFLDFDDTKAWFPSCLLGDLISAHLYNIGEPNNKLVLSVCPETLFISLVYMVLYDATFRNTVAKNSLRPPLFSSPEMVHGKMKALSNLCTISFFVNKDKNGDIFTSLEKFFLFLRVCGVCLYVCLSRCTYMHIKRPETRIRSLFIQCISF